MKDKDIKFINGGNKLDFAVNGFAKDVNGNAFFGGDFRDLLLTAVGNGTVIVYGSCQETPPDFTQPSTITNSYVPIVLADYSLQNTYYDGATGVNPAGGTKIVELNTNLLTWIAVHRSGSGVEVLLTETNAQ